ncbi:hypothetical protein S245_063668 [Arachis hypogaea]
MKMERRGGLSQKDEAERERGDRIAAEERREFAVAPPSSSPRLTVGRATVAGHLAAVPRSRPVLVTVAHPHHRQLRCPCQAAELASLPRHHALPWNRPAATTVTEKRH